MKVIWTTFRFAGILAALGALPLAASAQSSSPVSDPATASRPAPSASPQQASPTPSRSDSTSLLKPDKSSPSAGNEDWLQKGIAKEQAALNADKNGQKANPYNEKQLLDPQQILQDRQKAQGKNLPSPSGASATPSKPVASDKDSAPDKDASPAFKPLIQGLSNDTFKPLAGEASAGTASASAPGGSTAASFQTAEPVNPDLLAPITFSNGPKTALPSAPGTTSIAGTAPMATSVMTGTPSFGPAPGTASTASTYRPPTFSTPSAPGGSATASGFQSFSTPTSISYSQPAAIAMPKPVVAPATPTVAAPPSTAPYRSKVKDPNDFGFGH